MLFSPHSKSWISDHTKSSKAIPTLQWESHFSSHPTSENQQQFTAQVSAALKSKLFTTVYKNSACLVPRDSAMQFSLIEQVISSTHAQKENAVCPSYDNSVSLYPPLNSACFRLSWLTYGFQPSVNKLSPDSPRLPWPLELLSQKPWEHEEKTQGQFYLAKFRSHAQNLTNHSGKEDRVLSLAKPKSNVLVVILHLPSPRSVLYPHLSCSVQQMLTAMTASPRCPCQLSPSWAWPVGGTGRHP